MRLKGDRGIIKCPGDILPEGPDGALAVRLPKQINTIDFSEVSVNLDED